MSEETRGTLSPQELERRFDLLASESKEYAVFLVEPGGTLLCWNPGAERLFGYRSDEIIGQHFSRFFSPEDVRNGQPEHELKTASDKGRSDSVHSSRISPSRILSNSGSACAATIPSGLRRFRDHNKTRRQT